MNFLWLSRRSPRALPSATNAASERQRLCSNRIDYIEDGVNDETIHLSMDSLVRAGKNRGMHPNSDTRRTVAQ
jgi:hypothetical protein